MRLADFTQEGRDLYSLFTDEGVVGFSILLVLILYIVSMPGHKKDRKTGHSKLLTKFFLTLQYQYRLMSIAVALAACLAVLFFLMDVFDQKMLPYIMGLLCFITFYQNLQYFQTLSCD